MQAWIVTSKWFPAYQEINAATSTGSAKAIFAEGAKYAASEVPFVDIRAIRATEYDELAARWDTAGCIGWRSGVDSGGCLLRVDANA